MIRSWMVIVAGLGIGALVSACWGGVPGGTGHEGEGCRSSWGDANPCDAGLMCIERTKTCERCGGLGEQCCGRTCDGTLECRSNGGVHTCEDCGEVGEACCPSDIGPSCADFVHCNLTTNVCEPYPGTECIGGTTRRVFFGRAANGCATENPHSTNVDDLATAQACARIALDVPEVRQEIPSAYQTCEQLPWDACRDQTRVAFSASDAEQCARAHCSASSGCVVQAGTCPGTGRCLDP